MIYTNKEVERYAQQLVNCQIKLSEVPVELKSVVLNIVNDMLLSLPTLVRRQTIFRMIECCEIDELSIDPQKRFHIR